MEDLSQLKKSDMSASEQTKKGRSKLIKIKKIGYGTFSRVYLATTPGGTECAVKRRLTSSSYDFNSGLRELDINLLLGEHPHIIGLNRIAIGNPFSNDILSPLDDETKKDDPRQIRDARDDYIHFIYPLAESDLYKRAKDYGLTVPLINQYIVQLLLALEYIHGKGYIHRDIKTDNILIIDEETVVVADFGLAKPVNDNCPQTPGMVTSWYRAPEICLEGQYDQKSDIWSAAAVACELFSGYTPCGQVESTEGKVLARAILENLPYRVPLDVIRKMDSKNLLRFPIKNKGFSVSHFLFRGRKELKRSVEANGGYENFTGLMMGMLAFNPAKRFTASQALDHPYFEAYRDYIAEVRENYPPVSQSFHVFSVDICQDRRWICPIVRNTFKSRKIIKWYTNRKLFQALVIYDRMLHTMFLNKKKKKQDKMDTREDSKYMGKLFNKETAQLYFLACIYVSIKYFSTIQMAISFEEIAPPKYRTKKKMMVVENFEKILISDVLEYDIYWETPFDILSKTRKYTDEEVGMMLIFMIMGDHHDMTAQQAFEHWEENYSFYKEAHRKYKDKDMI